MLGHLDRARQRHRRTATTVDKHDRVAVPPDEPRYQLRRIWLTPEEEAGYYSGFANEGLWPLCHIAHVRPTFRSSDCEQYRAVNAKFADAVVEEAKSDDPIVLVQDYHFALLPRMIRERLPRATIITFWHIPWPNPEAFAICPWRDELLDGLLGSSILGFHTQFHCNNFLDTVDRLLEARVDRETFAVTFRSRLHRRAPLSDLDRMAAGSARCCKSSVADARSDVRERLGLPPDHALGIGVDRLDYTKGILERFRAVAAPARARAAVDRPVHVRADRGAVARDDRATTRTTRSACARSPTRSTRAIRRRRTRRSSCSSSITSPTRSTSTSAPPTCASCPACTTA